MNLDLASIVQFGDVAALRQFLLDHRAVHDQTAAALAQKYGNSFSTAGLDNVLAEDAWGALMRERQGLTPQTLKDWLLLHAQIHVTTYQQLTGPSVQPPDLSVVDFAQPEQFYIWMYDHSLMHDFEQSSLGLT